MIVRVKYVVYARPTDYTAVIYNDYLHVATMGVQALLSYDPDQKVLLPVNMATPPRVNQLTYAELGSWGCSPANNKLFSFEQKPVISF